MSGFEKKNRVLTHFRCDDGLDGRVDAALGHAVHAGDGPARGSPGERDNGAGRAAAAGARSDVRMDARLLHRKHAAPLLRQLRSGLQSRQTEKSRQFPINPALQ